VGRRAGQGGDALYLVRAASRVLASTLDSDARTAFRTVFFGFFLTALFTSIFLCIVFAVSRNSPFSHLSRRRVFIRNGRPFVCTHQRVQHNSPWAQVGLVGDGPRTIVRADIRASAARVVSIPARVKVGNLVHRVLQTAYRVDGHLLALRHAWHSSRHRSHHHGIAAHGRQAPPVRLRRLHVHVGLRAVRKALTDRAHQILQLLVTAPVVSELLRPHVHHALASLKRSGHSAGLVVVRKRAVARHAYEPRAVEIERTHLVGLAARTHVMNDAGHGTPGKASVAAHLVGKHL